MGFLICFFIIFCVGYCLERRDRRQRARRWKSNATNVKADVTQPEVRSGPSSRTLLDTFGDGVFEVGVDIAPGTYRSPGGGRSFPTIWHRLSDFTGNGIIAEGGSTGPWIVTIIESDRGFESLNSGEWTRIEGRNTELI